MAAGSGSARSPETRVARLGAQAQAAVRGHACPRAPRRQGAADQPPLGRPSPASASAAHVMRTAMSLGHRSPSTRPRDRRIGCRPGAPVAPVWSARDRTSTRSLSAPCRRPGGRFVRTERHPPDRMSRQPAPHARDRAVSRARAAHDPPSRPYPLSDRADSSSDDERLSIERPDGSQPHDGRRGGRPVADLYITCTALGAAPMGAWTGGNDCASANRLRGQARRAAVGWDVHPDAQDLQSHRLDPSSAAVTLWVVTIFGMPAPSGGV